MSQKNTTALGSARLPSAQETSTWSGRVSGVPAGPCVKFRVDRRNNEKTQRRVEESGRSRVRV